MALLPRFSIRQMMLAMIGVAMICAVFGWAARGSFIAYGLAASILILIVPFSVYAIVYWNLTIFERGIGWLTGRPGAGAEASIFDSPVNAARHTRLPEDEATEKTN